MQSAIEFPAGELKAALVGFKKIISNKATLPIFSCLRFSQAADHSVHIEAAEPSAFATFTSTVIPPGAFEPFLMPMNALAEVLKTLKPAERLSIYPEADRPRLGYFIGEQFITRTCHPSDIKEWLMQPDWSCPFQRLEAGCKAAIIEAVTCSSTDPTRYVLNGVCLDVRNPESHYVVGTNGMRLYAANSFRFDLSESIIIPNHPFLRWPGFEQSGDWSLGVETGGAIPWIVIKSGRWTVSVRPVEGPFPNWQQIIPGKAKERTWVKLDTAARDFLNQVLPRLPEVRSNSVRLAIAEGQPLRLGSCPDEDKPGADIEIAGTQATGQPVTLALDRHYLASALDYGLTELTIVDALTPVVFRSEGKQMVIAPMRLDPHASAAAAANASSASHDSAQTDISTGQNAPVSTHEHQERNDMSVATMTAPERENIRPVPQPEESSSAMKVVVEQIENIKAKLREVVLDLNETLTQIKAVEKENKATLKEIDAVRSALRSLQKVNL